jgi:hypothetical protein
MSTRTENKMRRNRGRWWWTVIAGAAIAVSGCESACPRTHLDLTLHGGFGYVLNSDWTIEAGFMKSVTNPPWSPSCDVQQLGVVLSIADGTIVSPPGQAVKIDVTNAVVTFDGVGTKGVKMHGVLGPHLQKASSMTSAAGATAAANGPKGQKQPVPRTSDPDWEDLFWVPHTRLSFLDRGIDPQWRSNAVTGRVVLAGGEIAAGVPSDGAAVNGLWEFRKGGTAPQYQQSITDRLRYKTEVNGDQIVINIDDTVLGMKHIVVAPIDNRHVVGLILAGRHGAQKPIQVNDPLGHFCTFYQLLDLAKRPHESEQLIPYYIGGAAPLTSGPGATGKEPTPGLFCPGDWP